MYAVDFRVAALRVYEHVGSLRGAAIALGVSAASLCRWKKRLHPNGWPARKYCETLINAAKAIVSVTLTKCPWTQPSVLKSEILQKIGVKFSTKAVGGAIRAAGYSYRRLRRRLSPRGDPKKLAEWHEQFRSEFVGLVEAGKTVIAVDESGFDHRVLPLYGYARLGEPAVARIPTCTDRRRHSLIVAARSDTHAAEFTVRTGSVKAADFAAFIDSLGCDLEGAVMVLDNAAIHKTALVKAAAERRGLRLMYIPPYSPLLNPVEIMFSVTKQAFRRERGAAGDNLDLCNLVSQVARAHLAPPLIQRSFEHVIRVIRHNLKN